MSDCAAVSTELSSEAYWEERFRSNWHEYGGNEQTLFFARTFANAAPPWFFRLVANEAHTLSDVGCAEGQAIDYLRLVLRARSATGIDVSETAIASARKQFSECNFVVSDVLEHEIEPADIVYCSNLLHLFDSGDRARVLGKLLDAAKIAAVLSSFPIER